MPNLCGPQWLVYQLATPHETLTKNTCHFLKYCNLWKGNFKIKCYQNAIWSFLIKLVPFTDNFNTLHYFQASFVPILMWRIKWSAMPEYYRMTTSFSLFQISNARRYLHAVTIYCNQKWRPVIMDPASVFPKEEQMQVQSSMDQQVPCLYNWQYQLQQRLYSYLHVLKICKEIHKSPANLWLNSNQR